MADVSKIEITFAGGQAETYDFKDPNAVRYTAQTLTDAQKKQARTNIGAKPVDDKLVLGEIYGIIPGSSGVNIYYGFKDIIADTTATEFNFSNIPVSGSKYKAFQFGDFIACRSRSSSTIIVVAPRPGIIDGFQTTGAWIRIKSGYKMFEGCTGLTSLDLSMFDTSEVKHISNIFYNCTSLETLDISSFDFSNVLSYNTALFGNANSLKTLKTPKINPISIIQLPVTMYTQSGTAYTKLPVTTGTSIELRRSWN
jgi:surface protein